MFESNTEDVCVLQYHQLESWGILRNQSVALLCTQPGEPAKPGKKTKAASKTAEASDERANLVAYKTTLGFPVKFSQLEVFPSQSLGISEQTTSSPATAETSAAATVPVTAASESVLAMSEEAEASGVSSSDAKAKANASHKTLAPDQTPVVASTTDHTVSSVTTSFEHNDLAAGGSSSSSSSDSDSESESDSDSEDEKSQVTTGTQNSTPKLSGSTLKKEADIYKVTLEVKEDTNKVVPPKPEYTRPSPAEALQDATPENVVETTEAGQSTVGGPSISSEELVDSAPEIFAATRDAPGVTAFKVSGEAAVKLAQEVGEDVTLPDAQTEIEVMTEPVSPEKAPTDVPTETPQPASAEAPTKTAPEESEAAAEVAADVSSPGESAEELVDCAPVHISAEGKLQEEAGINPSEEAAASAPAEPEESFDNSTYKNYQHHSYTPFTFVDLEVEMAKFRLPQPSSGRPSPRH
ncbi:NADH dehydrogenase [ubiquinone] flavoprotein 3, mitochondrial Complex I-9kD [Channa argus]|uniref:NADH dehydrogenase [ubiquinone] flavoprotein 3, mitochondrial Complex I-9kD n=2 Tax=Channa argus TaxID=215402 RepID=A0A6G1PY01_CHAAH|nr:NADH dehydrogenase [ubiquinone] flavoprotein 3, mitochondrial Complex I-9kD [Channa argus]